MPLFDFLILGAGEELPWANSIVALAQMGGAVALVWYYNTIYFPRIQAAFDAERSVWREHALKREQKVEELLEKTIECITVNRVILERLTELLQNIKNKGS